MRQCATCGKGSQMGGKRILLRGHYNPTSKSRKYPNLQWAKLEGIRTKVCAQCLKSLHKGPRVRKNRTTLPAAKAPVAA